VARPGEDDAVVSVETGLVATAWIEITTGLTGDEKVRLPGRSVDLRRSCAT
jgi:hypothetical protein